jgi:hypothetical protein
MKSSYFLAMGILFSLIVKAQSPVGKWRMVSYIQENRDGKKTDLLKEFINDYPCTKDALIDFDAAGSMTVLADKCPADIQQAGLGTKWKMTSKNKIIISTDDPDIDPVTYNLEFTGKKMRWTINYNAIGANDIKLLVAEFVKS